MLDDTGKAVLVEVTNNKLSVRGTAMLAIADLFEASAGIAIDSQSTGDQTLTTLGVENLEIFLGSDGKGLTLSEVSLGAVPDWC